MKVFANQNSLNFKQGLTPKIILEERFVNPTKVEEFFAKNYGTETQFYQNKTSALANSLCAKIFEELFRKLKLYFSFPPAIIQYTKDNLVNSTSALNFCIPDTKEVLLNDYPFLGRSIFFGNDIDLHDTDFITETQYKNKKTSSPHFLASYIHEWVHSLQLDSIFRQYGYGGDCEVLQEIYTCSNSNTNGFKILQELQNKRLSENENAVVYDVLGEYSTHSTNQYLEIFSEAMTKFICASLKGDKIITNPLELIKQTPMEFQKILKKVCTFTL